MKSWKKKIYDEGIEKGDYLTKNVIPGSAADRILRKDVTVKPDFNFDTTKLDLKQKSKGQYQKVPEFWGPKARAVSNKTKE